MTPNEIIDFLSEEDCIHLQKTHGKSLIEIVKAILFQGGDIKKDAEALAELNKHGVRP